MSNASKAISDIAACIKVLIEENPKLKEKVKAELERIENEYRKGGKSASIIDYILKEEL